MDQGRAWKRGVTRASLSERDDSFLDQHLHGEVRKERLKVRNLSAGRLGFGFGVLIGVA